MKFTLTILFAIVLCSAKAQTPEPQKTNPFQKPEDKLVEHDTNRPAIVVISETKYLDANSRKGKRYLKKYACNSGLIKPELIGKPSVTNEDVSHCPIYPVRKPYPPVDLMVRHYFAISYWD